MSSRDDHDGTPRRRRRVPAALAVAFVGSSAAVSLWYGGCTPGTPDPTPDAGEHIQSTLDAASTDAASAEDDGPPLDAGTPVDAPPPPPVDAPPDAGPPH